ncbi:MAG TPA: DUF2306 domain-containing protein [Gemmatimonadetes bacterium]|nr:DUF2306 domain-containing protein [Gemmatimonadota bacterium]
MASNMSTLGVVHVTFSLIAIGAGAAVVMNAKGTRWHRTFGHIYATSMVGLIVTAFSIYDLTGSFSPFHVAAFLSAVTVAIGLTAVLGRRPKDSWIKSHAQWMSGSYIGLIAALAAESLTRFVMPRAAPLLEERALWSVFWGLVILASFGVIAVGWWLAKTRLPLTLRTVSGPKR